MRHLKILILLLVCILTHGCSEQPQMQPQKQPPQKLSGPVYIEAKAIPMGNGKVMIKGNTNLPDQTELIISITNEKVGFEGSDNSKVEKGQFSTGLLGYDSGLRAGRYTVEIVMPIPSTQPDYVKKIIGASGEYLSGPLVSELAQEKLVEYSFPYIAGSSKQIELEESQHVQKISKISAKISSLYKQGVAMERYRNTEELSSLKTCGELMRRYQSQAKVIREEAEALPIKYHNLNLAAIELNMCVSCSSSAGEACQRVSEALSKSKNKNLLR